MYTIKLPEKKKKKQHSQENYHVEKAISTPLNGCLIFSDLFLTQKKTKWRQEILNCLSTGRF